ncbi:MAG: aldehyde dehydrogenase family protein [bacterium]|nr:aldehyde dehydrogenase family protein [bacterium]
MRNGRHQPRKEPASNTGQAVLKSINPATLEILGEVNVTPPGEVEGIVQRAADAFPVWRDLGVRKRAAIIKECQQLLLERSEELARTITTEMGRPYVEAMALEVEATADLLGYYYKKAKKLLSDRPIPLWHPLFKRRKSRFHREPLGVTGIVSPWNWPLLIPMASIIPALSAGNTVVLKPSEITPLTAVKIKELLTDAGVPVEVFHLVQGGGDVGRALVDSSVVKVFFTGSTAVGRRVMEQAAKNLKPVVLEMGGSDPAIVCEDADLDITASGIVWGGFSNCGQNCNSIERVFVHQRIADQLIKKVLHRVEKLRIGNGLENQTDIGPLASRAQLEKIEALVAGCVKNGEDLLTGGKPLTAAGDGTGEGYFFEPTIILRDKAMVQQRDLEIFGPVISITVVGSDEEAVRMANDSSFGLTASVWTADRGKGDRIARSLEVGSVMINDSIVCFGMPEAHWTGTKKSGIGWVHGEKGFDEMVNIQHINYEPQFRTQKFWWFPYTRRMVEGIRVAMDVLFSRKIRKRLAALPSLIKHFASYLLFNRKRKDKH